jgi:hypothetical protein
MIMRALPLTLAFLLASCLSAPPRQDPFADLSLGAAAAGRYKSLKLGVVRSNNTRELIKYMQSVNASPGRHRYSGVKLDPELVLLKVYEPLRRHFADVVEAETPAEAAAAGADLVAVVDCYAKIRSDAFTSTTFDLNLIFMTPAGDPLEDLRAQGSAQVPFQNMGHTTLYEAVGEARSRVAGALASSTRIADVAARKGGKSPAVARAAAAAPAPQAPSSSVDRPAYRAPENAANFAVVVGVEKYQNLPAADYAERDAAAVREHLLALGYPSRNIVLLKGDDAGRVGIEKYVESWLPRNAREDSTVFFYFSGHGSPDTRDGSAYLVPWDGDPKFLENTGYPLKRLYAKLNSLKARRVLVALDACFSGAGGRSVLAKGVRPLVGKVDAAEGEVGKLVVLSAAGPDEVTGGLDSEGHGLFTYHFLDALQRTKGEATVAQAFAALKPKVEDQARLDNREQTPGLLPAAPGPRGGYRFR